MIAGWRETTEIMTNAAKTLLHHSWKLALQDSYTLLVSKMETWQGVEKVHLKLRWLCWTQSMNWPNPCFGLLITHNKLVLHGLVANP